MNITVQLRTWQTGRKRWGRVALLLALTVAVVHETLGGYWWLVPAVPMLKATTMMLVRSRWPLNEARNLRVHRAFLHPMMYANVSLFVPVLVMVSVQLLTSDVPWSFAAFVAATAVQGWYCETVSWRAVNSARGALER